MTPPSEQRVTQADREAAAWLVAWHNRAGSEWKREDGTDLQFFTSEMPSQILLGAWDNHDVVQAFARHRHAATAPLLDLIEGALAQYYEPMSALTSAERGETLATALTAALAQHRTNGDG